MFSYDIAYKENIAKFTKFIIKEKKLAKELKHVTSAK